MKTEFRGITRRMNIEDMNRFFGKSTIHSDDEGARRLGLRGAIVQGGQLIAYLNEMMVEMIGLTFLDEGQFAVSFRKGVRPGDDVTSRAAFRETNGGRHIYDVWLENQHGDHVVDGTASIPA